MDRAQWTTVVMVVLILSLCISIVATAVSSLVHRRTVSSSWESLTFVNQRIGYW